MVAWSRERAECFAREGRMFFECESRMVFEWEVCRFVDAAQGWRGISTLKCGIFYKKPRHFSDEVCFDSIRIIRNLRNESLNRESPPLKKVL